MSGKTILAFQISETVSGEQFIRLVDIDGRTLSFYENGTREMGANRLYQIATALHVNANDLDLEWMGCTNVQTMQTVTFRGQQGRISRPVRAILSGQF